MRLLLAEDDLDLNEIMTKKLKVEGYVIDSCFDGEEALNYLTATNYDAAVLDIMMPEKSGLEVVGVLRYLGNTTPLLLLTAKDAVEDRVNGLDAGANDYLVKPFAFDELLARLRAMTRSLTGNTTNEYQLADLTLNIETHQVTRAGKDIHLSAREFMLLETLMMNKNKVLSRQKIEDKVWNYDYEGGTNVVDVYIAYLRKKIDEDHDVKLIHTIRGIGTH